MTTKALTVKSVRALAIALIIGLGKPGSGFWRERTKAAGERYGNENFGSEIIK